jgi:hypothetical protein
MKAIDDSSYRTVRIIEVGDIHREATIVRILGYRTYPFSCTGGCKGTITPATVIGPNEYIRPTRLAAVAGITCGTNTFIAGTCTPILTSGGTTFALTTCI